MTINDMISLVTRDYAAVGYFSINFIRIDILIRFGVALSYKQVRNSLYRMRGYSGWSHTRRGRYTFAGVDKPRYALHAHICAGKMRLLAAVVDLWRNEKPPIGRGLLDQ